MRIGLGLGLSSQRRGFTPTDVDNLALWLRADRGITLVSGKISAWADQSGAGVTVAQSTEAQRPTFVASAINGKPAARGSTVVSRLDVSGMSAPTAATIFLVVTPTANQSYLLSGTTSDMGILENFAAGKFEWFNGGGTDREIFATNPTAGAHILTVAQTNGGALTGYYDGAQVFTKTATANLQAIGAIMNLTASVLYGTDADFAELSVYSRVLTSAERANVHRYLGLRYGVTLG